MTNKQNKEEIWKDIPNMKGMYQCSNLARIKSVKRTYIGKGGFIRDLPERILKTRIDRHGYECLTLGSKEVKFPSQTVHRIVAITFLDNPENKPQVNHIDGVKLNNNLYNLEWCTAKENSHHAWKNGLSKVDEKGIIARRNYFLTDKNPKSKIVLNIYTGIYYGSALQAWQSTNMKINRDNFCQLIYGKRKKKIPFIFI